MALPALTIPILMAEAANFAEIESKHTEASLFGVTDGKKIGTYFEQKFQAYLATKYSFAPGNSASGIDYPALLLDVKTTSIEKRQSSCPFTEGGQKIFGLGYSLLIFVYQKTDDAREGKATLKILHTIFVEAAQTADYQMTSGLREIVENKGNEEDIVAFLNDCRSMRSQRTATRCVITFSND